MVHSKKSPLADQKVRVKAGTLGPDAHEMLVQDWWDRIAGESWGTCTGNIACLNYAARIAQKTPMGPLDDEVVYGKIGGLGYLVHVNEIETPAPQVVEKS